MAKKIDDEEGSSPQRSSGARKPSFNDLDRVADLEKQVLEAVQLIHLWKNEALAYRALMEQVVQGQCTLDRAKSALKIGIIAYRRLESLENGLTDAD